MRQKWCEISDFPCPNPNISGSNRLSISNPKSKGPAIAGPNGKSISRILFPLIWAAIIYLGQPSPTGSIGLPSDLNGPLFNLPRIRLCQPLDWNVLDGKKRRFTWPFISRGLPGYRCRHQYRWALTPPFHPYPPKWAVYFLLHLPSHQRIDMPTR